MRSAQRFHRLENRFTGAVTYEPSVPLRTESDEDAVLVHAFLSSDLDLEAERLLEIIGETRTQHPDGTIAVLVRSRSHLFGIVSALRRAGERFSAVEIDALGERPRRRGSRRAHPSPVASGGPDRLALPPARAVVRPHTGGSPRSRRRRFQPGDLGYFEDRGVADPFVARWHRDASNV